jgi:ComF family protein
MINLIRLETQCILCGHGSDGLRPLCGHCELSLPYSQSPCLRCGIELAINTPAASLCGLCLKRPPIFDRCYPLLRYVFPIPSLMSRFKDGAQFTEGALLASLLASKVAQQPHRPHMLIPVPLHSRRLRQRGFNQSQLIAAHIAAQCAVPVRGDVCARQRNTPSQRGLDRRLRRKNLLNAFHISAAYRNELQDQHVAIVDDVVTTTSTANILANLLKSHGARTVDVYCIARVDSPNF